MQAIEIGVYVIEITKCFCIITYIAALHEIAYDISQLDSLLDGNTAIIYKDSSKHYSSLRSNAKMAFEEGLYSDSVSYGHASYELCTNGEQKIGIYAYVESDKYDSTEVEMVIERTFWIFYRVKSIKSNDSFFGYFFFREL